MDQDSKAAEGEPLLANKNDNKGDDKYGKVSPWTHDTTKCSARSAATHPYSSPLLSIPVC